MASTRAFLALALVALALIATVEAARELRGAQDTVITNCRNYGAFRKTGCRPGLQICQNHPRSCILPDDSQIQPCAELPSNSDDVETTS
jgi:hypothetical protein